MIVERTIVYGRKDSGARVVCQTHTIESILREFAQAFVVDEIDWDVGVDAEVLHETAEKIREVLRDEGL